LIATSQPWSRVRFWLDDLATELSVAEKDGTRPEALGMDRVWITRDGRAKLLDFPAPGAAQRGNLSTSASTIAFLNEVATAALAGSPGEPGTEAEPAVPLPVHARRFLQSLPQLSPQAV